MVNDFDFKGPEKADKKNAIFYLEKAIQITSERFPKNSPHFMRIQAKLKQIGAE